MSRRKKWSWFDTSNESYDTWAALCPPNEWRIVSPSSLSGIIPQALRDKSDSVFIAGSQCGDGTTYYMANYSRVDSRGTAIDQEPLGLAFVGTTNTGSGCLLHHGTWCNRTVQPAPEFWDHMKNSGLGYCYPFSELPCGTQGKLADLAVSSQKAAFSAVIDVIRRESSDSPSAE